MDPLNAALDEIARTPVLLVASDFDGTLAPASDDPELAEADRESVVALKALSSMAQTHAAIISRRALADLASRVPSGELHLMGSHGSEFEAGQVTPLPEDANQRLTGLITSLQNLAASAPGLQVEVKPAAVAFHYRNADKDTSEQLVQAVLRGPGSWPGVHLRHDGKVIELSVVPTNKGLALQRLRQRLGATAVLVMGNDVTNEDLFATLAGPDVGVKVGPGDTLAKYRVAGAADVARVLAHLAEARASWLAGSHAVPIEHHAMLSDQRTIALVTPAGRVVWLCLPRIDSSAIFAELLGGPVAGYFEISPEDGRQPLRQRYSSDTFVVRTEWPDLTLIDYLDCAGGRGYHRAGRTDLIRVVEGHGRIRITFAPRLDFGRVQTQLRVVDGGVEIEGTVDPVVLYAPGVQWNLQDEGQHQTAIAEVEVSGEPLALELRYGTGNLSAAHLGEPVRRELNQQFWSSWASSLTLPPLATDLVRRSALVLRALIYGPTGALAAAGTTSLPEHAGGVRNWDYRFCWPRDAAMGATALVRLGAQPPAMRFLDWVLGILEQCEPPAMLRPVYSVTGGNLGPEAEIADLAGYRGSRPVRFGNAAAQQVQLDVFGPIAELLATLAEYGAALSSEHWRMLELLVGAVASRWQEPDHGIWEFRKAREHYVHSKVMCWLTVDRALSVARYLGRRRKEWEGLRDTIAQEILTRGWNSGANAFCATYDGQDPDAATLSVILSGLLPPEDPRCLGTLQYVERKLRAGPGVFRYLYDDGLPGQEGAFNLCAAWLIESYALVGRMEDAYALFEAFCKLAGPSGLFAEEYDPVRKQALGNYPQAYTHVGLINAALRLSGG